MCGLGLQSERSRSRPSCCAIGESVGGELDGSIRFQSTRSYGSKMPEIHEEFGPWANQLAERALDEIDTVVLHSTEQPTLQDARRSAIDSSEHLSGHYYLDRDG